MSGVVLRCPNCGTTKAAPGECEACHEAQVRYFCTNHAPGRWLDAPACPDCGARLGGPAARPAAAPPPPSPARTSPAAPSPPVPAPRGTAGGAPWGRRRRPTPPGESFGTGEEGAAARDPVTTRLTELLRTGSRVRRMRPGMAAPTPGAPVAGPSMGGCLARFLFLAVFLLLALLSMSLLVGGSLLQVIGIYY